MTRHQARAGVFAGGAAAIIGGLIFLDVLGMRGGALIWLAVSCVSYFLMARDAH